MQNSHFNKTLQYSFILNCHAEMPTLNWWWISGKSIRRIGSGWIVLRVRSLTPSRTRVKWLWVTALWSSRFWDRVWVRVQLPGWVVQPPRAAHKTRTTKVLIFLKNHHQGIGQQRIILPAFFLTKKNSLHRWRKTYCHEKKNPQSSQTNQGVMVLVICKKMGVY